MIHVRNIITKVCCFSKHIMMFCHMMWVNSVFSPVGVQHPAPCISDHDLSKLVSISPLFTTLQEIQQNLQDLTTAESSHHLHNGTDAWVNQSLTPRPVRVSPIWSLKDIFNLFSQLRILSRRATVVYLSQLHWTLSHLSTQPFSYLAARWCSCLQTVPCSHLCFCCQPSQSLFLQICLTRLCWHIAQGTFILIQSIKSFICQRQNLSMWDISSLLFCSPWPTLHQII